MICSSYKCAKVKGFIGIIFWIAAVIALVLSYLSIDSQDLYGISSLNWMLTSIALSLVGLPCNLTGTCPCGDCGGCGECDECNEEECKNCKNGKICKDCK